MKKAGMRYLIDVVPLDATLVKSSHGRIPEDRYDWPILAGDFPHLSGDDFIQATEVFHERIAAVKRGIAE